MAIHLCQRKYTCTINYAEINTVKKLTRCEKAENVAPAGDSCVINHHLAGDRLRSRKRDSPALTVFTATNCGKYKERKNMNDLILKNGQKASYLYTDRFDRPVYKLESGTKVCCVNLDGTYLHTLSGSEPCSPLKEEYQPA